MKSFRVMLLCNDDHGMPEGSVATIEIPDEIYIVPTRTPPTLRFEPKDAANPTSVKIGRYSYPCRDYSTCVGNVFWDAVTMDHDTVHLMLERLLESGGWVVESYEVPGPFAELARRAR